MKTGKIIPAAAVIVIIIAAAFGAYYLLQPRAPYHVHADFEVVLDGAVFDFNKPAYMSSVGHELSSDVHLHDFVPTVIHFHSQSASLGDFFKSLGMDFNSSCFFDGRKNYCSNGTEILQFYVNGAPNTQFENYKPQDLDKILIYYGAGTPSQEVFDSIPGIACAYSKKCASPPGIDVNAESCESGSYCPA